MPDGVESRDPRRPAQHKLYTINHGSESWSEEVRSVFTSRIAQHANAYLYPTVPLRRGRDGATYFSTSSTLAAERTWS